MAHQKDRESGQVTIMHLLLGIALLMPIVAATTELNHSGSGPLRYLVAFPLALGIGVLIVSLDWQVGKAIWMRSQRYSHKMQTVAAIGSVGLTLLWIILGAASGFKLATFVTDHVSR